MIWEFNICNYVWGKINPPAMCNHFHFNTDFGDMSEDAAEGWKSVLMRRSSVLERLCSEAVSTYRAIVDDLQIQDSCRTDTDDDEYDLSSPESEEGD